MIKLMNSLSENLIVQKTSFFHMIVTRDYCFPPYTKNPGYAHDISSMGGGRLKLIIPSRLKRRYWLEVRICH